MAGQALATMLTAAVVDPIGTATRWYLIPVVAVGLAALATLIGKPRAEWRGTAALNREGIPVARAP